MSLDEFKASLAGGEPPPRVSVALRALWWDAKGDWKQAHDLVNDLETTDAMAVHAYLHRKEGDAPNAEYWYQRSGRNFRRATLEAEWEALARGLLETAR
jgi:hypothetical protein